ncbi:MAG: signal transduction histidine kinase [Sulfurimonas sp.]|jgi:signal transduction histidine kinase|uniref:sensor histidine kinase n=1 Tax=Sulfurimonas sp. TaxID=2022749 RepID=UPI0039E71846
MIKFNTLQARLVFILIIVATFMIAIVYTNYYMQKMNYQKFINYSIQSAINTIKSDIKKIETTVYKVMIDKYSMYEEIHGEALEILKTHKEFNLEQVREELNKKYSSGFLLTHLYLINEDNIIYKTTDDKDLNLDMTNFLGAREYLDQARKNPRDIFLAKTPSFDVLNKKYTIYSYATLDEKKKIILEVSFFDEVASKMKAILYQFDLENSIIKEVDLFSNYGKYIVNITNNEEIKNISKQEYLTQNINSNEEELAIVRQVSQDNKTYNYSYEEGENHYSIFYTYLMDVKISDSKMKNYVLKTKLDVTLFEEKLYDLKLLFYLTLVVSFIFILVFFIFLNNTFVQPFKKILNNIRQWKRIEDEKILSEKNELSELAYSFNEIYAKQVDLNNTLEERISQTVEENRKKNLLLQQQSKLALMGEMLSMIAHQWRQPLGAIGSSIITLQLQLKSKRVDFTKQGEVTKYIEEVEGKYLKINEYVQFLSITIDDFKNFFKPNNKKELVSVLSPIKKALQLIEVSMKKEGIKILTNFHSNQSLYIYQNELIQVILNILKNSEDNFVEKKVLNPEIHILTKNEQDKVLVVISDNGGGIAESIIPNIFNPYFSTKNKKNGTGLGLYMSKIMVEEHNNGLLQVCNNEEGVSFTIVLKYDK